MTEANLTNQSDAQLETLVLHNQALQGAARAELEKRRRAYEEETEESRRAFETERDKRSRQHDFEVFDAESERDTKRKIFEERLADKQMERQEAIAAPQEHIAKSVSKATRAAAWAAGFSALATLIAAGVAVYQALHGSH